MRNFVLISLLITLLSLLYQWRYKLLNMILTISILRKFLVRLSMNWPVTRINAKQ